MWWNSKRKLQLYLKAKNFMKLKDKIVMKLKVIWGTFEVGNKILIISLPKVQGKQTYVN